MTPAQADAQFLENAKKLSMYGVDLHHAKVPMNPLFNAQFLWCVGSVSVCLLVCVIVSADVSAVQTLSEAMGTASLSRWDSRSSAERVRVPMCVWVCLCLCARPAAKWGEICMRERESLNRKRGCEIEDIERQKKTRDRDMLEWDGDRSLKEKEAVLLKGMLQLLATERTRGTMNAMETAF